MSLGFALKGTEGIVLAADSRVTLLNQLPHATDPTQKLLIAATFDNATKLLKAETQQFVAAVTFGMGAIGGNQPRTASSFMPEFEAEIARDDRLRVEVFAKKLSDFFANQWKANKMPDDPPLADNMVFMVGGYDPKAAYGTLFGFSIPSAPKPNQLIPDGMFGANWGGQREAADRILQGFDPSLPDVVQDLLGIVPGKKDPELGRKLREELGIAIPWQFLPLQDCVDLAIFIVRTTIELQKWTVGLRGVGGAVDVVTITRTDGLKEIQLKQVIGERV